MKKIASVILALLIVCSLVACNGSNVDTTPNVSETETTQNTTEPTALPETTSPVETSPATAEDTKEAEANTNISAEFKAAMDSYEAFFDEYVAIMKKYKENPTDMSILADYANYMGQYADMMQKFEKWESENLNATELAYYIEVQARITQKLLEIA